MTFRTIADFAKSDVLLAATLKDASGSVVNSLTGPDGGLEGTGAVAEEGLDTGAAGSCRFTAIPAGGRQLTMTLSTRGIADRDNSGFVNLSDSVARASAAYMWTGRSLGPTTNTGSCDHSAVNQIRSKAFSGEISAAAYAHSIGKGETTQLTWSYDDDALRTYVDGVLLTEQVYSGAFTNDVLEELICGAHWNGTGNAWNANSEELYQTNVLISSLPYVPVYDTSFSLIVRGDSFAAADLTESGSSVARRDTALRYSLPRLFMQATGKLITVAGSSGSGETVSRTGVNDLDDGWSAFLSTYGTQGNWILLNCLNNDSNAASCSAAQATDVDDGVKAVLTEWCNDLLALGIRNIMIPTPCSFGGDSVLDTALNNTQRILVTNELLSFQLEFMLVNPSANIIVFNRFGDMGGNLGSTLSAVPGYNLNYQGHVKELGNTGTGGSVTAGNGVDDRHLSAIGGYQDAKTIFEIMTSSIVGSGTSNNLVFDSPFYQ